jgi:hypothetical protein
VRWRLRRLAAPASPAEVPTAVYSDLCWLLAPDSSDQVVLAQVLITADRLVLRGEPTTRWYPTEQDVGRVAQIDVRTPDVELLCVETGNTLGWTRLRFATDDQARTFVAQLAEGYRRAVGESFPPSWMIIHPAGRRAGDEG